MNVTPLDIRKQTFRRVMQGFARDDVIAFLGIVADQLEALVGENRTLSERATSLEFQLATYREMESSLRNAMVTAEKTAEDVRKQMAREEEIRLREIEMKVQRVADQANERIRDLKREIRELEKERAAFIARFRLLVEAQVKMLDLKIAEEEEEDLQRVADLQEELLIELERSGGARRPPERGPENAGGEPGPNRP